MFMTRVPPHLLIPAVAGVVTADLGTPGDALSKFGITPVFWKDEQLAADERPAILPMVAQ